MRALVVMAPLVALCGCDGAPSDTLGRQIDAFEAAADARRSLAVLDRLAGQHGLDLKGGLYLGPAKAAAPPVNEATIEAGDCLLLARRRGSGVEVSLHRRGGRDCPEELNAIFREARRQLGPAPGPSTPHP